MRPLQRSSIHDYLTHLPLKGGCEKSRPTSVAGHSSPSQLASVAVSQTLPGKPRIRDLYRCQNKNDNAHVARTGESCDSGVVAEHQNHGTYAVSKYESS